MRKPKALDLFCCAGGVSVGLSQAGFDVVAVDINPQPHHRGGTFVQADALTYPLEGFDFIWASPPCQAYTSLRHLTKGKVYPDLIASVRERLQASGTPYCIENVPGAPLGVGSGYPPTMLCGTMFGLQTPDGRAEIRRHRHFETSFYIPFRLRCQHGYVSRDTLGIYGKGAPMMGRRESLSVCGTGMGAGNKGKEAEVRARRATLCIAGGKRMSSGMMTPQGTLKRRAVTVTGNTAQTNTKRNQVRETFSINDARLAMGIDWMPMKYLSQAIPPAYAEWIGRQVLAWEPSLSQFGAP